MKATIDIPDQLYRRVKAKAAQEGRRIREVAIELFQDWTAGGVARSASNGGSSSVPIIEPRELKSYKDIESLRRTFPNGYRLAGPLIPARKGAKPLRAADVAEEMERIEREELKSHAGTR